MIATSAEAEVYRWQDKNGEPVYGDVPPDGVQAEVLTVEEISESGTHLATPQAIDKMKKELDENTEGRNNKSSDHRMDYHCRNYVSQLNKIEIYLDHTYTDRDAQKAKDLRALIKKECGRDARKIKHSDWRCTDYQQDLAKTELHVKHSSNDRDLQKIQDLKKRISRECG